MLSCAVGALLLCKLFYLGCRTMAAGKGPSCMWLGSDMGSACQAQLTIPDHLSCAAPTITIVLSLGLHGSQTPSVAPKIAESHCAFAPPTALFRAPPSSPASPWSPTVKQGAAYLASSKTELIKATAGFETDSTNQQQLTAERSSSGVGLKHTSPRYQASNPPSHVLNSSSNAAAAGHSTNAITAGAAVPQPAVADQVKDSHKLSGMGASQLAHDGPVQHILVAKDRVVTSGGVGAGWTLREWSFLGKLMASHKACEKGTTATNTV